MLVKSARPLFPGRTDRSVMSKPTTAEPVKLIFSVFATEAALLNKTITILSAAYGQPDFISAIMPFDYTDYYCAEMGDNLVRRFLSMEKLIRPEDIARH